LRKWLRTICNKPSFVQNKLTIEQNQACYVFFYETSLQISLTHAQDAASIRRQREVGCRGLGGRFLG